MTASTPSAPLNPTEWLRSGNLLYTLGREDREGESGIDARGPTVRVAAHRSSDAEAEALITRIQRFLSSPSSQESTGGARKLEWTRVPDTEYSSQAETVIGVYRAWTHREAGGEWFWTLTGIGGGIAVDGSGASEDEVRDAAQADLDRRIVPYSVAGRGDDTPDWLANCCRCGRVVDKRERSEGGDDHGCELGNGSWTCSFECWDAATGGADDDATEGTKVVEQARATIQRLLDATPFNTNSRDVRDAFTWFHTVAQSAMDDLAGFPGAKVQTSPNREFAPTHSEVSDALADDYGEKLHADSESEDGDADYAVAEEVASRDLR